MNEQAKCGSEAFSVTYKYWLNYLCYSTPGDGHGDHYPDARIGSYVFGGICLTE